MIATMAIALVTGTGLTTSVPTQTPLMPAAGTFRLRSTSPTESVFVNTSGALDQPNQVRHAVQSVADVFKNTGVVPDSGQRITGMSILSQVTEVWKVEDAANTAFDPYYLPVSAHFVLKIPDDALITSSVLEAFTRRMLGTIWGNAAHTLAQALDPLLRGVTLLRS